MHLNTKIDLAIAGFGIVASTVFLLTDGNGQNPIPVFMAMAFVALASGVLSFAIAKFVPTVPLAVCATIVTTDMAFLFYFYYSFASSQHDSRHALEEFNLVPIVFTVVTAPTVVLSSIGFGRIANRCFHWNDCARVSQGSDRL